MKLFDSHCHLDDRLYDDDMDEVIKRMDAAGVAAAMIVGVDKKRSEKAVAMAESGTGFYASVGVHPHEAKDCSEETLEFFCKLAKSPKVKAWGEIGLDFNRMYSSVTDQEKWFARQLETADELRLPIIFHERDTKGRFLEILKAHYERRTGVVHCFSGNKRELEEYLQLGLCIGVTGILTIKTRGADLRKLVSLIPADRILIETDAPFLTPAPQKNHTRRNEPAFVKSVLLKLAEVRKEEPEYLADMIWENTCRLYNIT
ncbi:TatD family hydrolase [Desulfonema magnum]|uniref:Hydrolase, TatD-like n=1 Tax=Desulfonema magnum TaxID=45655 RepID=A0A975BTG4_9BACT|nr:TatD family hydrolase [Desulfonema magnum]QTA91313.1 Hydrolase, TatD-like [Desulfonema magnum]